DTISSGFGRLFAISDPPFPNHNGGPLQWGRIMMLSLLPDSIDVARRDGNDRLYGDGRLIFGIEPSVSGKIRRHPIER
ncbi:hypothetical protein, partial [Paracoccus isoporae]|uniref:hypothetical protein n=1 Tax=Paracoccus isoporae TaxID=591205 RepID=UPI001C40AEAB